MVRQRSGHTMVMKRRVISFALCISLLVGMFAMTAPVHAATVSVNSLTSKYYPACDSDCESIVTGLNSIGVDSSKEYRTTIAAANGITDYSGTAEQNVALLELLKAGKLINPEYIESSTSVYYPACPSTAVTLIEGLNAIGVDSSKEYRTKIALANGITDYSGTAEQNTRMLELLKAGQLRSPDSTSDSSGSFTNGYDYGYTGGMAGDGKIYAHGLDVSSWQGASLDFNAIKNAGYDYVILRAGTGKGKDTCFDTFYTNARAAGLDIGAYYYSYATTVAGARTDASSMLSWISGKTFEYPVYFDYEDASQDNLSTTTAKNICLTFCDAMAEAGYLTGVYTGYYRSTQLPMNEICARYEVWIARYYDNTYESLSPTYSTKYGMYQYTDRKYIGSNGPYDADVAYKDYPSIVKQYGFSGYPEPDPYLEKCEMFPSHSLLVTTKSAPLNTLPCSAASSYGSQTLVTAEADQTFIAEAMYLNTSGNYWYQLTLSTGETAYLYSGHTQFVDTLDTDITISDAAVPEALIPGDEFVISGTVKASFNKLDSVDVMICTPDGSTVAQISLPASENMCDLSHAALDFTSLVTGSYGYKVIANSSGCYAAAAKEKADYTISTVLVDAEFTVGGCPHSFTTTVIQVETCTTPGLYDQTCTLCGITSQITTAELGHDYATTVVDPTCTDAGQATIRCTRCPDTATYSISPLGHSYESQVIAPGCTEAGFTVYTCTRCADSYTADPVPAAGHSYADGSCTVCGAATEYYLFGLINGANYGCEEDADSMGSYRFRDGTLTAVFTQDSYVAVKTGGNTGWYMTNGWQGTENTSAVLYNAQALETPDRLFVPGGVEVTFSLTVNGDDTLTLSYEVTAQPSVVPTLSPSFPTLTFEDVITMNIYFQAADLEDVVEMGMITYSSAVTDYGIGTAEQVIPGYSFHQGYQMYAVSTGGIAAKDMSDVIYFSVYALLSDGSYTYSRLLPYSPTDYAYSLLSSGDADIQKLMIAMLNYGAEAQTFFGYRTDALMNARLIQEQQSSIESYRSDMMAPLVNADSSKVGIFTNSGGFSRRYPSVSFEGAFCINYYFTPAYAPSGSVKMYYWTQADYNAAATLTPSNATGCLTMAYEGNGVYAATIDGIAAKDLDKAIYVAGGYNSNGTSYCTGVLAYSIGAYCTDQTAYTSGLAPFAQATAVYGYYAKDYFYK